MNKNSLNGQPEVRQFTGTMHYYKHVSGNVYTDGVQYVASQHGVYWFLDLITSRSAQFKEPFTVWNLERLNEGRFKITADDGNENIFYEQEIVSDFKYDCLQLFFIDNVLLLPSEY